MQIKNYKKRMNGIIKQCGIRAFLTSMTAWGNIYHYVCSAIPFPISFKKIYSMNATVSFISGKTAWLGTLNADYDSLSSTPTFVVLSEESTTTSIVISWEAIGI